MNKDVTFLADNQLIPSLPNIDYTSGYTGLSDFASMLNSQTTCSLDQYICTSQSHPAFRWRLNQNVTSFHSLFI